MAITPMTTTNAAAALTPGNVTGPMDATMTATMSTLFGNPGTGGAAAAPVVSGNVDGVGVTMTPATLQNVTVIGPADATSILAPSSTQPVVSGGGAAQPSLLASGTVQPMYSTAPSILSPVSMPSMPVSGGGPGGTTGMSGDTVLISVPPGEGQAGYTITMPPGGNPLLSAGAPATQAWTGANAAGAVGGVSGAGVTGGGALPTDTAQTLQQLLTVLASLTQQLTALLQSLQGGVNAQGGGGVSAGGVPVGTAGATTPDAGTADTTPVGTGDATTGADTATSDPSTTGGGAPSAATDQATQGATGCGCCGEDPPAPPTSPAQQDPTTPPPSPSQNGDDVRQKIVDAAKSKVGVKEGPNNSGDQIVEFRRSVTGPGEDPNANEPWCADFASWAYQQAGNPAGFDGQGSDYVPQMMDWGKQDGRYHDKNGFTPKPGDMIIFDWEHDGKVDHVGIVESVDGGKVHTIEGNSSDQVAQNTYALDSADITGYISAIKGQ